MNLPLRTDFAAAHRYWFIVYFDTLTTNDQKEKLNKQPHLPSHQKE